MKKILIVIDERIMGGVSVLLEDMLNMINLKKYKIDILCLHNNGEMLENLPENVNMIYGTDYFSSIDYTIKEVLKSKNVKKIYYKVRIVFDMKTGLIERKIKKERKKILKEKYDVEVAFKDGFTALFTIFGNSKRKIHWIQYEYKKTNPNAKYDKLFKKILPKFDNIVAVSKGVAEAFNDLYHLENKTCVIPNLIDTNKIKNKSKEVSDVKLSSKSLNVVSVGRLHEVKAYDRLIKVIYELKQLKKLPSNFKLRIYGDGPEKELLIGLIKAYELEKYILLMGKVSNPYKYIKENDLFILPSLFESFGLVMVESMTLGVPVLSTMNNVTSKIIKHDENGYITENSEEGLYKGLLHLIENPDKIKKYKNKLKDYKYENDKIIKQIEKVFDN